MQCSANLMFFEIEAW